MTVGLTVWVFILTCIGVFVVLAVIDHYKGLIRKLEGDKASLTMDRNLLQLKADSQEKLLRTYQLIDQE